MLRMIALCASIGALLLATSTARAMTQDELAELLTDRALEHGADPATVISLARCEGGGALRPEAIGAKGERGLAQWYPGRGNH